MEPLNHSTGTVTVTALSSKPQPAFKNPNDVEFDVKYSDEYKGPRFMKEGIVIISKESAEQFTKAGIGEVVAKEAEPVKEENPVEQSAEQFTKAGDSKQKSSSKAKDNK